MTRYTLDAGRCIVKDGVPLATIHGVGNYSPTELDELARRIVSLLRMTQVHDAYALGYAEAQSKYEQACGHLTDEDGNPLPRVTVKESVAKFNID